jgi:threonine/homoserine/homoserine lactone efflux protein
VLAALLLGVAGGLSPGPLHSLILTTALRDGPRAGARVAVAPLLSDLAPVAASLVLAATLPDDLTRWLSVVGGLVLIGMAAWTLRGRPAAAVARPGADYLRGALTNVLNPNPWIFWLGAGAPLLAAAFEESAWVGVGWLAVFYTGLVGVKLAYALGVGMAREALSEVWLRRSVVVAAVLMAGVGLWLVLTGITSLTQA